MLVHGCLTDFVLIVMLTDLENMNLIPSLTSHVHDVPADTDEKAPKLLKLYC